MAVWFKRYEIDIPYLHNYACGYLLEKSKHKCVERHTVGLHISFKAHNAVLGEGKVPIKKENKK